MRLDSSYDAPNEFIIIALAVDEREDCVNMFPGRLFKHLSAVPVDQSSEGRSSELEDGFDEIDRDVVVIELEPCLF